MDSSNGWKQRLAAHFKDPPIQLTSDIPLTLDRIRIDFSTYSSGSQFTVYTQAMWGNVPCAVKMVRAGAEPTQEDNMTLLGEAYAHLYIQRKYRETQRPMRIIPLLKVTWIDIEGYKYVCLVMERFEHTLFRHNGRMTREELAAAVRDIGMELHVWNSQWSVFHRDVHIGNVGWYSGRWVLFDVGMATWAERKRVYAVPASQTIYRHHALRLPHEMFDLQLLHMSCAHYFGPDFNRSTKALVAALQELPPEQWIRGMPVYTVAHGKGRLQRVANDIADIKVEKGIMQVATRDVRVNARHPHTMYYFYERALEIGTPNASVLPVEVCA